MYIDYSTLAARPERPPRCVNATLGITEFEDCALLHIHASPSPARTRANTVQLAEIIDWISDIQLPTLNAAAGRSDSMPGVLDGPWAAILHSAAAIQ